MKRRALLGFVALNIFITILFTWLVITVNDALRANAPTREARGLLQVVITATPDPLRTPEVLYVVVTATPEGTRAGIAIQPTPVGGIPSGETPVGAFATSENSGTQAPLISPTDPSGCPTHQIKEGEILGRIAPLYGVTVADIMRANKLSEADVTRLQIGQVLIIPAGGCMATETPTLPPTRTPTATPPPTSTPEPTLAAVKLEVIQILSPGDITNEGIELQNVSGGQVNIGGWTLRDGAGNVYTFPDYTMYEGRRVIVYTRAGEDGPLALYWGLTQPIWGETSQTIRVVDAQGIVQLSTSIGSLPTPSGGFVPTPTPGR